MSRMFPGVAVLLVAASATMAGLQIPADPPPVGEVVAPDGTRLHYAISGKGPTIVVLHGGPGLSSTYLAPNLDFLAAHYRLISYDQRGAGRSTVVKDPAKLSRDHHVEDIEAVRRHFGLDKVVLLGHSWGAAPAAFYAKTHPDRVAAVILLDPIPARSDPWIDQFETNLRRWMDDATSKQVAALAAARRGASDPVAACRAYWAVFIRGYMADPNDRAMLGRIRGDVCDAPPEAIANGPVVSSAALGSKGWDWRAELQNTDVPALIMHGDKDPIPLASADDWQKAFPRSTLVPITGAGHFSYIEQPQAILRAIQPFVMAHPPSAPFASQAPASPPAPAAVPATGFPGLDRYRASKVAVYSDDYGERARYSAANTALPPPAATENRVVFFGDSITDGWRLEQSFPGKPYVNRGIGGQTTSQMLVRFRQDVIALRPKVVVILAGTNDIAGNTGPIANEEIEGNLASLADLARMHDIRVVLSSVMPVHNYTPRAQEFFASRPSERIVVLNRWMREYTASTAGVVYLDYHSAMVDDRGMLRRDLAEDGLHPNATGYAIMARLADEAIQRALTQNRGR